MATAIIPGAFSWSMSRDEEGHRTYKVTYLVECTRGSGGYWPGPAEVLQTTGIPVIGDTWAVDNDIDVYAYCTPAAEVKIHQSPDSDPVVYAVTSTFSTKRTSERPTTDDAGNANPVQEPENEPDKISVSSASYTEEADHDRFGNPIVNSAHEPFKGPQVEFDCNRFTVHVEQNVSNPNFPQLAAALHTLNSTTMWGFPPRCVKFSSFTINRMYKAKRTPFYARTMEFDVWTSQEASSMQVVGVSITAAGSGYTSGSVLTVSGGTFTTAAKFVITSVTSGGAIRSISMRDGGDYTVFPSSPASVTGGGGSGATVTLSTGFMMRGMWDKDLNDMGTRMLKGKWVADGTGGFRYQLVDVAPGVPPDPANPAHFQRAEDQYANPTAIMLDGAGKPYDPDHAALVFIDKRAVQGTGNRIPASNTSGLSVPSAPTQTPTFGGSMSAAVLADQSYSITAFSATGQTTGSTPTAPLGAPGDKPHNAIKLTWAAVTGAIGYGIYRRADSLSATQPFRMVGRVAAGKPGVIHVEKYGESDLTLLGIPLQL